MPYVQNWLHCVWGTKNRIPFLANGIKDEVLDHIIDNARLKDICIKIINGHTEHVHCLLSLYPDQSLSKIIQMIKGESSFWINRRRLSKYKFEWAVEYYAFSVSKSHVQRVYDYIKYQEEHHKKRPGMKSTKNISLKPRTSVRGFQRLNPTPDFSPGLSDHNPNHGI
jgi:putative transposase